MHRPNRWRSITPFVPLALLALAVLLYAAWFSFLTIQRYQAFESRALDMGNLHQAIWNTAHGDWFRMTNQKEGLTSRLSMHVEPILLVIAAIYRLWPRVETLLVLQAAVVALGAVPLFALARRSSFGPWVALVFAVVYLLNPTIQSANWLEFHPVTLVPALLIAAFYFLACGDPRAHNPAARPRRPNGWFILFAILAASCKEEIGLLVAMMGLYAALVQRRWRFGLAVMTLGAGWSLLAVLGIQAAFAGGNIHWDRYGYLGATTADKLISLVTRPDLIIGQLQAANVGRYFFQLLLPVGFLSLLAPEVLLLALPSLAINLLAQFPPMHEVTTLIYAAPIVPFVLASAVMGAARLIGWIGRRQSHTQQASGALATTLLAFYVLGAALLGQHMYGYLPASGHAMPLSVTAHHLAAKAVLDQIPPDAVVSAQDRLNPHVAGRRTVYIFPRVDDANYVLLDVTGPAWPQHPNDLHRAIDELLQSGFGIVAAQDGYLLLGKGAPAQALGPAFYTAWLDGSQPAPGSVAIGAQYGDELRLDNYRVRRDRNGELVIDMTWTALQPLGRDLRFYVAFLDTKGNLLHDNIYYQPVSVLWYPTSMWQPGQPVHVQTLPWQLADDQFVLAIGVFAGEDGWTSGGRLAVTNSGSLPVLEDGTLLRLNGYERASGGEWAAMLALPSPWAGLPLQPIDARLGQALWLKAGGMPANVKADQGLPLHIVWQSEGEVPPNLVRFVHVLDGAGNTVAQVDGQVSDAFGPLPVAGWPQAVPVDDLVTVDLPADLPPGSYSVVAGLYDWQSGERQAVTGKYALAEGAVLLDTIEVME